MKYQFSAKIYQTGINWAVDVPTHITESMKPEKGYIRVKGVINGFEFTQTLVPVKNGPYRLFVNLMMMKGAKTALGEVPLFEIEQNFAAVTQIYPMPPLLAQALAKHGVADRFSQLTPSRQKDILKYLFYLKNEGTMLKHIEKVVTQLKNKDKNVRIP